MEEVSKIDDNQQNLNDHIYSKYTRPRVRVYKLDDKENWNSQGTGTVYVDYKLSSIVAISEEDSETVILNNLITSRETYQRQGDTIIVWNKQDGTENGLDLALSFQDKAGADEILWQIDHVRSAGHFDKCEDQNFLIKEDEFFSRLEINSKSLPSILDVVLNGDPSRVASAIIKNNTLDALCDFFKISEDLEVKKDLNTLFIIFKHLIISGDPQLIDQLLSLKHVFDVVGALEYDSEMSKKMDYRNFLRNKAIFNQVVDLPESLIEKIHFTYRLQYVIDVILPRVLDENAYLTLNSLLYYNYHGIVRVFAQDLDILGSVLSSFVRTGHEKNYGLLMFLMELYRISEYNEDNRKTIYSWIVDHEFLSILKDVFSNGDDKIRHIGADLLVSVVECVSSQIRSWIFKDEDGLAFVQYFIDQIHTSESPGVISSISDFFTVLLNIANEEESHTFVTPFYSYFMANLMSPLRQVLVLNVAHSDNEGLMKNNLMELLNLLLVRYYRLTRNFLIRNQMFESLVLILKCKDVYLYFPFLRFIRLCLLCRDRQMNHEILKHCIYPIMMLFLDHKEKSDCINSTIIDFFRFINTEKLYRFIAYIVENFYPDLRDISYTGIFRVMHRIYQDKLEADPSGDWSDTEENVDCRVDGGSLSNLKMKEDNCFDTYYELDEVYFEEKVTKNDRSESRVGLVNYLKPMDVMNSDERDEGDANSLYEVAEERRDEKAERDLSHSPKEETATLGEKVIKLMKDGSIDGEDCTFGVDLAECKKRSLSQIQVEEKFQIEDLYEQKIIHH